MGRAPPARRAACLELSAVGQEHKHSCGAYAHRHDQHAHGHLHDHAHAHGGDADGAHRVGVAFLLTSAFFVAEVIGGLIAGSLTLLADAAHMLADAAALALAWFGFRISGRPSDARRSYGYQRFQVLTAFVNGLALVFIAAWIVYEAVQRLLAPTPVRGGLMLAVGFGGLLVNVIAWAVLHRGDARSLNLRAATAHVLSDMLGSAAAVGGALLILAFGWLAADPLLALFVAALIVRSAWRIVTDSAHILLEGVPEWLDVEELRSALKGGVPDVHDIHHVHAWCLSPREPLITLHANVRPGADATHALMEIKRLLAERFGILHSTVQIEPEDCADRRIATSGG
jgi:cobalt-zinc-cadmium efflux system protein